MATRPTRNGAPDRLNDAAERIGAALGHLAGQIDGWQQQRDEIASELRRYISHAQEMLTALGSQSRHEAKGPQVQGVRRGRQRGAQPPAERQQQHEDWKAQRREMKLHERGVGKKATHAKKPVVRPLMEK